MVVSGIVLQTVIYVIIGLAGYISLGNSRMVDLIALRPRLNKLDIFMNIGILSFMVVDMVSVTVNLYPGTKQIRTYFNLENNFKNHVIVTESALILACLIVFGYPEIMDLFGLCGGILCSTVGWTIPFLVGV